MVRMRLAAQLRGLDGVIGALGAWARPGAQTVVLVATEFGRTVANIGTGGTDHGTAAAAVVVGDAVHGEHIVSDWPGLATADLLEGGGLKSTLALDTLIASTCAQTFSLDPERTVRMLFPDAGRSAVGTVAGHLSGRPECRMLAVNSRCPEPSHR